MIITKTPYRISFFGGGTDYPEWYRNHGGAVLATTINKYCHITCRYLPPFFENRYRVVWYKIEDCEKISQITHPSVREGLRYLNVNRSVEIHHIGDLPGRSGVGSSSAFTVGLLNGLHALAGCYTSPKKLTEEAIHIEQDILKETVGSQDQACAAHGGLNRIEFSRNGEIAVRPMITSSERVRELESQLLLFYTGIVRTASGIAKSFVPKIETNLTLYRIREYVDQGCEILNNEKDLVKFGELLHKAWLTKREISDKISNSTVDAIYSKAKAAGAIGGKLLGAGAGGFLLLFVTPEKQAKVRKALNHLLEVPFSFESHGSQVVYLDHGEDFSTFDKARLHKKIEAFRILDSSTQTTESLCTTTK